MRGGLDKAIIALIVPHLLAGPQFFVVLVADSALVGDELVAALGLGIFGVDEGRVDVFGVGMRVVKLG